MSTPRRYRPLTGLEVIEYVLAEFRQALVNSNELPAHRTFHELSFVGGVKVSGWGSRDSEVRFQCQFKAEPEAPDLVRERLAVQNATYIAGVADYEPEVLAPSAGDQQEAYREENAKDLERDESDESDESAAMVDKVLAAPSTSFPCECGKEFPKETNRKIHWANWCKLNPNRKRQ